MDLGSLLLMLGLSYGFGLFWYDLLPAKLPERIWRVAEAVLAPMLSFDPKFGGISLLTALIGSLVGVIVDSIITTARHPAMVMQPEPRLAT